MSKSTLSIVVPSKHQPFPTGIETRTIEVPCRLPEAFNFKFGGRTLAVEVDGALPEDLYPYRIECDAAPALTAGEFSAADAHATSILATIKAALGITGPVPPGSPLPAIALAYEAEVAAYEASLEAFNALPVELVQIGLCANPPDSEGPSGLYSPACRMLAKYVEHVVQNAAAQEVK